MTVLHPQASERRGWLSQVRRVRVGSANEPKISAVRAALAAFVADGLAELALDGRAEVLSIGCAVVTDGRHDGRHSVLCALVRFLHPSPHFGSSAVGEAISRTDVAGRGFA